MRQLIGEVAQVLWLLGSLAALGVGLAMIHPGLLLAGAGLTGVVIWILWIRRDRPVPGVPPGTGQRDSREDDPDDDGRMEVRPL